MHKRGLHMPELQTLLTGLAFGESPRWSNGRLWFSDFGAQEVVTVNLEGSKEVIAHVPGAHQPCTHAGSRMAVAKAKPGQMLMWLVSCLGDEPKNRYRSPFSLRHPPALLLAITA